MSESSGREALDSAMSSEPNGRMKVITAGRTTNTDFWEIFGPTLLTKRLNHTPLLAFVISDEAVTINVYDRASDALDLRDDTPLMVQWPGQWRSDWFQLTVGELRAASRRTG